MHNNPKISGNKIVWVEGDFFNPYYDIYLYDLINKNTIKVMNDTLSKSDPNIFKDIIVWSGSDGGDYEIYMYNTTSNLKTQITDNTDADVRPSVSGNYVAWSGEDGSDYDVMVYDIEKNETVQVTANSYDDLFEEMDKNRMAWIGSVTGSNPGYEIFIAECN